MVSNVRLWHTLQLNQALGAFASACLDPRFREASLMMKTSGLVAFFLLFAQLQLPNIRAQTLQAAIRGQVADVSGSACPNVQVTCVNEEAARRRTPRQ